jgi:hypothetical protein
MAMPAQIIPEIREKKPKIRVQFIFYIPQR